MREPLKKGSSIDHLDYVDVTPIIGREYPTARLKDMLQAPNAEEQLRDLAITICERGVVFFRTAQDDLSVDEQKHITDMLGKLTGRPKENGLHVHPLYNDPNNLPMADGTTDKNMQVLDHPQTFQWSSDHIYSDNSSAMLSTPRLRRSYTLQ